MVDDLKEQAYNLANNILQTWASEVIRERRPPNPHAWVYAGGWRACDRRLVYDLIAPDKQAPFSADVLANFRRGSDRGREVRIDLEQLGRAGNPQFEVFGAEERFELRSRDGSHAVMVGKTDCSIRQGHLVARVEIKNWNPNLTARINRFEDLFDNKWTRAGAFQLLSYLYGSNQSVGFMVLDRPGIPKVLPVVLYDHLDEMEEWLTRAEMAVAHAKAETMPDYHKDPAECKRCPFFGWCNPPLEYDAATVLADEDLIQLLEAREAVVEAGKQYEKLHKQTKDALRGVEAGIAGDFFITGKWQKLTTYPLTEEQKLQFRKTDPKGKFVLSITKMTDPVKPDTQGDVE